MDELLSRAWWMLALRGIVAILFGILTLVSPDITLLALVAMFAAFALVSGTVAVIGAIKQRKVDEDWWLPLLLGIAALGAGVLTVVHPGLTAIILVLLIGANALVTGVLDIAIAIRLRKAMRNEWMLIVSGAVSILFGVLVMLLPEAGAVAVIWMIGIYALLTGALLLTLSLRLRQRPTEAGERRIERRVTPDRRIAAAQS